MSQGKIETIRQTLHSSYEALLRLLNEQLTPLDPALLYRAPAPEAWTIMENLAHINEFLPYWASEIEKLVASPGKSFGRTQQHEGRLGALREHGHDTLEQIKAALPGCYAQAERVLATLTEPDLRLTGVHPKYGERTLEWFINDFLTKHLSDHIQQIKDDLAYLQAS